MSSLSSLSSLSSKQTKNDSSVNDDKIYLLKTHLKTEKGEPLYKIGRSKQKHLKLVDYYTKIYRIILVRACIDSVHIEKEIIKRFIKKYKIDFKNDYFKGDVNEMIQHINEIINNECKDKELIIIKSKLNEHEKTYYITDRHDTILREIINTPHMEYILTNDYLGDEYEEGSKIIEIKENSLYDINDKHIMNSIIYYVDILGEAMNIYEKGTKKLKKKFKNKFELKDDVYSTLPIKGKLVYLFETDTVLDNIEGHYFTLKNELYLFSHAPKFIFEISSHIYDENFLIKGDLLIHYFRKLGKIYTLDNPLQFILK